MNEGQEVDNDQIQRQWINPTHLNRLLQWRHSWSDRTLQCVWWTADYTQTSSEDRPTEGDLTKKDEWQYDICQMQTDTHKKKQAI